MKAPSFQKSTHVQSPLVVSKTKFLFCLNKHFLLLAIVVFAMLQVDVIYAESTLKPCAQTVGHIASLEGTVTIQRTGSPTWQPAALNTKLCKNDSIHVAKFSRAAVSLINKAVLRLKQNTTIRLIDIAAKPEKNRYWKFLKASSSPSADCHINFLSIRPI